MRMPSKSGKLLLVTASVMGYLLSAHYTCDLTSRMTTGPEANQIRSFRDVIDKGYRVIVQEATSNYEILEKARVGTPMHTYFFKHMKVKYYFLS